jgi:hypothetical protein
MTDAPRSANAAAPAPSGDAAPPAAQSSAAMDGADGAAADAEPRHDALISGMGKSDLMSMCSLYNVSTGHDSHPTRDAPMAVLKARLFNVPGCSARDAEIKANAIAARRALTQAAAEARAEAARKEIWDPDEGAVTTVQGCLSRGKGLNIERFMYMLAIAWLELNCVWFVLAEETAPMSREPHLHLQFVCGIRMKNLSKKALDLLGTLFKVACEVPKKMKYVAQFTFLNRTGGANQTKSRVIGYVLKEHREPGWRCHAYNLTAAFLKSCLTAYRAASSCTRNGLILPKSRFLQEVFRFYENRNLAPLQLPVELLVVLMANVGYTLHWDWCACPRTGVIISAIANAVFAFNNRVRNHRYNREHLWEVVFGRSWHPRGLVVWGLAHDASASTSSSLSSSHVDSSGRFTNRWLRRIVERGQRAQDDDEPETTNDNGPAPDYIELPNRASRYAVLSKGVQNPWMQYCDKDLVWFQHEAEDARQHGATQRFANSGWCLQGSYHDDGSPAASSADGAQDELTMTAIELTMPGDDDVVAGAAAHDDNEANSAEVSSSSSSNGAAQAGAEFAALFPAAAFSEEAQFASRNSGKSGKSSKRGKKKNKKRSKSRQSGSGSPRKRGKTHGKRRLQQSRLQNVGGRMQFGRHDNVRRDVKWIAASDDDESMGNVVAGSVSAAAALLLIDSADSSDDDRSMLLSRDDEDDNDDVQSDSQERDDEDDGDDANSDAEEPTQQM